MLIYNLKNILLVSAKGQLRWTYDTSWLVIVSVTMRVIQMPAAFTPNTDGINDVFKVKYPFAVQHFHLIIYNRFGSKVFETTDISKGWNGTFRNLEVSTRNAPGSSHKFPRYQFHLSRSKVSFFLFPLF